MPNMREVHRKTLARYEADSAAWDQQRSTVFFEKAWLDRFIACLPAGGEVLDLGCGAGIPIARYLLNQEFRLTGVDGSPSMIAMARSRFPQATWIIMDMRALSLPRCYAGIVAWDSFFHLDPAEQRLTIPLLCNHLKPGGALLLTIGDRPGEVLGSVNGRRVYHASLAPEEYLEILKSSGFNSVIIRIRDGSCNGHSVVLASGFEPRESP